MTNLHIQNPDNIHSIAIESIFDTGSQVIPHEQMWDQLQRAFAANGHLKVTSAKSADALLRAHIRASESDKAGDMLDRNPSNVRKDPDIFAGSTPAPPSLANNGPLRDLTTASRIYTKDATTFVIDVEVWNLETHKLMLQRTYRGRIEALAITSNNQLDLAFIRHDEIQDRSMTTVAKQIAENVVSDLLVR